MRWPGQKGKYVLHYLWHGFIAIVALLMVFALHRCIEVDHQYTMIAPGTWRGVIYLDPRIEKMQPVEPPLYQKRGTAYRYTRSQQVVPFTFEVRYLSADSFQLIIRNADERIVVDDIRFSRGPRGKADTLILHFPEFASYIHALVAGGYMEGKFVIPSKQNYALDFEARFGDTQRFHLPRIPSKYPVEGRWKMHFTPDDTTRKSYYGIGEFQQRGHLLYGTVMTETGDYRYLEGVAADSLIKLSTFNGYWAFLFEGTLYGADSMAGIFRSGPNYKARWTAVRDDDFRLGDPDTLTKVLDPLTPVQFRLPSSEGGIVDLDAPPYRQRPVIVQIMGTWCPNCLDESRFLAEYAKRAGRHALPIIGVAFERFRDTTQALRHLKRYKERLGIPYPLVLGGKLERNAPLRIFPQLEGIKSYPTLLLLDSNHRIRYVHTGFAGPATSEYPRFQKKFEARVRELTRK